MRGSETGPRSAGGGQLHGVVRIAAIRPVGPQSPKHAWRSPRGAPPADRRLTRSGLTAPMPPHRDSAQPPSCERPWQVAIAESARCPSACTSRSLPTVQACSAARVPLPSLGPGLRPRRAKCARARRAAAPAGQVEIRLIFERDLPDAHPLRSRSPATTRAPTSPISTQPARRRPQGVDEGHRPRARLHVRRDQSTAAEPDRRDARQSYAGVPVFNSLTDKYHPTQMLADVMDYGEHSDKPLGRSATPSRRHATTWGHSPHDRRLP